MAKWAWTSFATDKAEDAMDCAGNPVKINRGIPANQRLDRPTKSINDPYLMSVQITAMATPPPTAPAIPPPA